MPPASPIRPGLASGSLDRSRKDAIVVIAATDVELARTDLLETEVPIDADRLRIAGIDTQQQAPCMAGAGMRDRGLRHGLADATALELRQQVDALEFEVRGIDGDR